MDYGLNLELSAKMFMRLLSEGIIPPYSYERDIMDEIWDVLNGSRTS